MMKHANIKQLGCLILTTALLVGVGGCGQSGPAGPVSRGTGSWEGSFVVADGVLYLTSHTHAHQNGKFIYALTLVSPRDQHYYPAVRYVNGKLQEQGEIYFRDAMNESRARKYIYYDDEHPEVGDTKIVDVPFHFVYFIDNGKIVFQKSHEKLGIDVSDHWHAFDSDKLYPILETLIRENVPPQETEMEEEL